MGAEFGRLLASHRIRSQMSGSQLARAAGIDPSYVGRLERGQREPPHDTVLAALVRALCLTTDEQSALWRAAGRIPRLDTAIQAVERVLASPDVSEQDKAAFRQHIEDAAQWIMRRPS